MFFAFIKYRCRYINLLERDFFSPVSAFPDCHLMVLYGILKWIDVQSFLEPYFKPSSLLRLSSSNFPYCGTVIKLLFSLPLFSSLAIWLSSIFLNISAHQITAFWVHYFWNLEYFNLLCFLSVKCYWILIILWIFSVFPIFRLYFLWGNWKNAVFLNVWFLW